MRLAVTGGRHYFNRAFVFQTLNGIHARHGIDVLIHGACPTGSLNKPVGADWLADAWARFKDIPILPYPVIHQIDGPWPVAGPRRNQRMLTDSQPDALVHYAGGTGTKNCMQHARDLGIMIFSPSEFLDPGGTAR